MLRYPSTLAHFLKLSILAAAIGAGFCLSMREFSALEAAEAGVADQEVSGELLGEDYRQHWRGYASEEWPNGWRVDGGVLTRFDSGGDIMTKATYSDFVLKLEWKISEKGNSGIMYRVRTGDDAAYFSGPEYQVLDNQGHADGADKSHRAAALYGLYAPEKDWTNPVGQWNETRIVVSGNHVQHFLNGHKTVDCLMGGDEWNELVKNSKFDKWKQFGKSAEGHIVLQDHGDPVWYRNVSVQRLDGAPDVPMSQAQESDVSLECCAPNARCARKCTCQPAKKKRRLFRRCKN